MKTLALLIVSISLGAACNCRSEPEPPSAPPVASGAIRTPPALPHPSDAQALLTDDKLGRFAVYHREMLPAASIIAGAGLEAPAVPKGAAKKPQAENRADETLQNAAKVEALALAKSGLTRDEVAQLSKLTTEYFGKRFLARALEKQLAQARERLQEAKAQGGSGADVAFEQAQVDSLMKQIEEYDKPRREMAARYGKAAVDALDKHEQEFIDLQQKAMEAMAGTAR